MPTITNRGGTIQKTVRFPVDMVAYVEQFQGNNFSDRLLNLIEKYQRELPEHMERLERLEREIRDRSAQCEELDRRFHQLDEVLFDALEIQPTFCRIRAEVLAILETMPEEPKALGEAQPPAGDRSSPQLRRQLSDERSGTNPYQRGMP